MMEGNMGREVTYFQPTQHSNQQIALGYKQARQEGGKFSFFWTIVVFYCILVVYHKHPLQKNRFWMTAKVGLCPRGIFKGKNMLSIHFT